LEASVSLQTASLPISAAMIYLRERAASQRAGGVLGMGDARNCGSGCALPAVHADSVFQSGVAAQDGHSGKLSVLRAGVHALAMP
jgi:hypothetical protein